MNRNFVITERPSSKGYYSVLINYSPMIRNEIRISLIYRAKINTVILLEAIKLFETIEIEFLAFIYWPIINSR